MIRRSGHLALVAILIAAGGVLVTGALRGTLTYYRTPAELTTDPDAAGKRVRLGGSVVPGSLRRDGEVLVFQLAEDGHQVTVRQRGVPPDTFREGEGAVVEGRFGADGVFHADALVVRHGNEYGPASTPRSDAVNAR
jgi:cytochrome c-type biogenesis protein CcmE